MGHMDFTTERMGELGAFREWDIYGTYGTCVHAQTGHKQDEQDIFPLLISKGK